MIFHIHSSQLRLIQIEWQSSVTGKKSFLVFWALWILEFFIIGLYKLLENSLVYTYISFYAASISLKISMHTKKFLYIKNINFFFSLATSPIKPGSKLWRFFLKGSFKTFITLLIKCSSKRKIYSWKYSD